ncbi:ABC transporter ATP-binding protein [Streptomyces atratus]|uniref:ABC transporter ATP-binding protein n=1 Tax=Streptomyces atratus TaxID=1893 RepID=UPI0033CD51D3
MTVPSYRTASPHRPVPSREPVLDVRNLRVEYGGDGRTVVGADNVSFTIGAGEIFGLAGESGCGKSTVANAVMRLLKPPAQITAGSVVFNGRDVLAMDPRELRAFRWREIAMVFQSAMNSLNPVLTIGEQIGDIFTTHERTRKRQARARAGELLELVGIDPARLKAYPHQLSGGMRQRVVIAMAVALKPTLLIMDEPTTALDVVVQQEIMDQIGDLQCELGFSVLFITHDMSLMVELSHRMGVMYGGRLVELAAAKELFAQPLHPYTQALMNAFPPLTGPRVELTGLADTPRTEHGCGFHAHCPDDRSDCSTNIPDLREVAAGRFVARTSGGAR